MTRLYGRALKNSRCYDSAPDGRWERQTLLSSIRENGATESIVFDGALDRKMFDEYIIRFLAPTLRAGDIVIMDNLLIFQIFTKQYLAKLLHCMAWNYQAAKQKTFGSTGDCGQWNFLKAE